MLEGRRRRSWKRSSSLNFCRVLPFRRMLMPNPYRSKRTKNCILDFSLGIIKCRVCKPRNQWDGGERAVLWDEAYRMWSQSEMRYSHLAQCRDCRTFSELEGPANYTRVWGTLPADERPVEFNVMVEEIQRDRWVSN